MSTSFVNIGDYKLYYQLQGKGFPTITLESGHGSTLDAWNVSNNHYKNIFQRISFRTC